MKSREKSKEIEIVDRVLEKIKKEDNETIISKVNSILEEINNKLKENNIKANCFLGGSLAKGTYLPEDYDADVFVRFDYLTYKDKNDELSDFLGQALKDFKPKRVHGSRDYFQFKRKGIRFEVVPVLNINSIEEAMNITDISPLHVIWFKNKANDKIRDSVRLSKLFCKANEVYGAESFIRGFSGHVLDILNVKYKSFLRLLKEAVKWEKELKKGKKIIVDVENYYKGKAEFELNKSKTQGPLIVIDPIQKERNAAAALSYGKFKKFIETAKEFLKNPSESFFIEEKPTADKFVNLKEKKEMLIVLEIKPSSRFSVDVMGCKMMKIHEFIKRQLAEHDFIIKLEKFYWSKKFNDTAKSFFIISNPKIKEPKIIQGPPLDMKEAVEKFMKVHKKTRKEKGRIVAFEDREFKDVKVLIKSLIKEKYIKEKARISSISFFD